MSIKALSWAFAQKIGKSGAKFVLVALADYADDNGRAWPCVATLADKTDQERRTVLANLRLLRAAKLIERTPERIGVTRRVVIYRLAMPDIGPHQLPAIPRRQLAREGQGKEPIKEVPNAHHSTDAKEVQNAHHSNGAGLAGNGAGNRPEIGTKRSPGTLIDPSMNPASGARAGTGTPAPASAPVRPWTPGAALQSQSGIKATVGDEAVEVEGIVYQNQALANIAIAERDRAPIPNTVLQYRESLRRRVEVDKKAKPKEDAAELSK